ncbi:mechanosensitive ion channel [Bifidobacterium sp. H6bp22N]|uniref:mechanosensitive ion channel family protein n=1 Tax=Bifidobacterium polysaccharolyticum TaxID=2750967 RepID=UPI0028BF5224|nr:mechanosensitive ion channel domain-containing protein [Bifidobacterium sp. H6bp22N]MDT7507442.1 mechanosensitive ion channel [Bifidobacterium sp. H6bp22N]
MGRSEQAISSFSDAVIYWFRQNFGKIILLIVVAVCAALISKIVAAAMRRTLERTNLPSASIFVNIVRALIWIFAAATVLQPVFGINPSTVVAALGVSGLALSFGLKDTIANIVGGFGLMVSKVVQPGDIITIQGTTGTVRDVTWRHTIVIDRTGNQLLIPNSILNTTALEKITEAGEAATTVPFTLRGDADIAKSSRSIAQVVAQATKGMAMPSNPPIVQLQGFTPYGIKGQVVMFAKQGVIAADMQDAATRALAGQDYLVQEAKPQTNDIEH